MIFKVNLNITEAEEEVIGGEKVADLSELQPGLGTDLVPGGDVEQKLSVWEDDSLWDLGKATDEDGGGEGGGGSDGG